MVRKRRRRQDHPSCIAVSGLVFLGETRGKTNVAVPRGLAYRG